MSSTSQLYLPALPSGFLQLCEEKQSSDVESKKSSISTTSHIITQRSEKKKIRRGRGKHKEEKLTIFSSNSEGLRSKINSFKHEIRKSNAAIFTIQETHFMKKGKLKIPGYEIFEAIRSNKKGGGTLIGVHKALKPMLIKEYSDNFELLCVDVKINNYEIRVISGYGPQETWSEDDRLPFFLALEDEICKAELAGISTFVQMDANSKLGPNIIPNDPHFQSLNGKLLAEILERHSLSVVNGTAKCNGLITRQRNNEKSIIDFVIVSKDIFDNIDSLLIDEERNHTLTRYSKSKKSINIHQSDHNVMITSMNFKWNKRIVKERVEIFNFKNKDCQLYFKDITSTTNKLSKHFDTLKDLDTAIDRFLKELNTCIHKSFKKIRIKENTNEELHKLFERRKVLKGIDTDEARKELVDIELKLTS